MTVTRVAHGNKRTRRGRKEMRERFLSIDRPFDSPPPELNDGGGPKLKAIGIDVTNAQRTTMLAYGVMRVVRGSKTTRRLQN